jgi:DNA-binding response OmpR family regulator
MQSATQLTTILVVEDSPQLVAFLQRMLSEEGYGVRAARDGESGLSSALENEPDLLIVDVGLPYRNGFEVVRELRRKGVHTPTLMLTARAEVADRITGLDSGADDYLVKPFEAAELSARVRALLRRAGQRGHAARLRVGEVQLDPVTRRVFRGDRELMLTQREFALLEYFMKNVGQTLSRTAIAEQVWRHTPVDAGETNIVDVYVAYLRKKLDTPDEPPLLHTVRGIGYVLRPIETPQN